MLNATVNNTKMISIWLKVLIIFTSLMILIGGITRLTYSGLSMSQWKPFNVLPPLNQKAWNDEFSLYQKTPEYQKVNNDMKLSEFKKIYWWEYIHRNAGRLLGLLIFIPAILLWKKSQMWLKSRIIAITVLCAMQGLIGWWMVKSGLKDDPFVSPIRLGVHLLMAFLIISVIFLSLKRLKLNEKLFCINKKYLILLIVTIFYGALVAGLKAGLIYNTFPLMEGQIFPQEAFFYSPKIINFLKNQALVQFCHRFLAICLFSYTLYLFLKHKTQYKVLFFKVLVQLILGITTLVMMVPIEIAILHQMWAIVVFISALNTIFISEKNILK